MAQLNIALVHDYLREYGGAERVLEELHKLYPDAPVYVGFVDWHALGIHGERFKNWQLYETRLTRFPFYKKLFSPYRIFAPSAFAALDLSAYDVVISSSNAYFAKAVHVPNGKHLCYCHTPPRALYGYSTMSDWKANPLTRWVGTLINHYLRVVDAQVAARVDVFIANSRETQQRIKKFYRRDSVVVYPPVTLADEAPDDLQPVTDRDYYLYVNRLALAKHPEIAVAAATRLRLPLKVVGQGKMLAQLREQAGPTVEFLGGVSDQELQTLLSGAKGLLYPVEDEDFGIVPVEAMAFGVPVIAHRSGGPKETIEDGVTGVLFDELSTEGLETAIKRAEAIAFDVKKIAKHARKFRPTNFDHAILERVARQR